MREKGKTSMTRDESMNEYFTLHSRSHYSHKIEDSRFIGHATPCFSRKEAEDFIEEISAEHSEASHNAFAWRVFGGDEIREMADDDGEPPSSAGPPILQRIKGEELLNVVVVVTRYFGGTKLGIGGLIKAYGGTAARAIEKSGKTRLVLQHRFYCRGSYDFLGEALGQLERLEADIKYNGYDEGEFMIKAEIEASSWEKLESDLRSATGNSVSLEKIDSFFDSNY